MSTQPSIISDRPYSVASDDSKRGTFALYCGGVAVCFGRSEAEAQAMADSSNNKHERIAKRKRLEAAAPDLLAAAKTLRRQLDSLIARVIENPDRAVIDPRLSDAYRNAVTAIDSAEASQ